MITVDLNSLLFICLRLLINESTSQIGEKSETAREEEEEEPRRNKCLMKGPWCNYRCSFCSVESKPGTSKAIKVSVFFKIKTKIQLLTNLSLVYPSKCRVKISLENQMRWLTIYLRIIFIKLEGSYSSLQKLNTNAIIKIIYNTSVLVVVIPHLIVFI